MDYNWSYHKLFITTELPNTDHPQDLKPETISTNPIPKQHKKIMPSNYESDYYHNAIYLGDDEWVYLSDDELQNSFSYLTKAAGKWIIKKGLTMASGMPGWVITGIEIAGRLKGNSDNNRREYNMRQTSEWVQQGKMTQDQAYDYVLDRDLDY